MPDHDAIIIGAGFAGLYQLHRLRELGFSAHVIEAGGDVGGTWYWNRYPGARCDVESIEYSYSFDPQLEQEWNWSERYATQPEILSYAQHVAERYDLRRDVTFNTRVEALDWDDDAEQWTATTDTGTRRTARHVIAATGCLSVPSRPEFAGAEDFTGEQHWTSSWPHEGVDLEGKRVAVIGTGSSGLQTITAIAPAVSKLVVFQRTPSYAIPARNGPVDERLREVKARYPEFREQSRAAKIGMQCGEDQSPFYADSDTDTALQELERRFLDGGLCYTQTFRDLLRDAEANEAAAEYLRERIRQRVHDPELADKLTPTTYPVGAKRLCVDTGYFETFNQDHVSLVDINEEPIRRITARGVVAGETEHEVDVIIHATGFDAMTGALNAIDIRSGGRSLREKWSDGPRTYLGLMSAGFPNLFMITGPQSPSVLSNMMTSIEYHVDWVANALRHLRDHDLQRMEPDPDAEENWVNATNDIADLTVMPGAASWYMGANIPGKKRVFMPFVGGVGTYRQICDGIAVSHYHGFELV